MLKVLGKALSSVSLSNLLYNLGVLNLTLIVFANTVNKLLTMSLYKNDQIALNWLCFDKLNGLNQDCLVYIRVLYYMILIITPDNEETISAILLHRN